MCTDFYATLLTKIVEKDFIYYNIIAIKWGESTHFPGRTGNWGETTRIHTQGLGASEKIKNTL
jgi:hypothetical protein